MSTSNNYGFDLFTTGETGWGPSASANFSSIDGEIARPRIPYNAPAVGGTTTLDLSLARFFAFTVDEVTTIAISNAPTNAWCVQLEMRITNGAAFAVTFPASFSWLRGVAPTLQAAGVDVVRGFSIDGGTTWHVWHLGPNLSLTGSVVAANATLSGTLGVTGATTLGGTTAVNAALSSRVGGSTTPNRVMHTVRMVGGLTATSTALIDVTTYVLAANTLSRDGVGIRVTAAGTFGAAGGFAQVTFGGTVVCRADDSVGGATFYMQANILYAGVAQQRATGLALVDAQAVDVDVNSPTIDETAAITIAFAIDQAGAGTFTLQTYTIEVLDADSAIVV